MSINSLTASNSALSQGNKPWVWQIFVQALDEFPGYFLQLKTSVSDRDYSESS